MAERNAADENIDALERLARESDALARRRTQAAPMTPAAAPAQVAKPPERSHAGAPPAGGVPASPAPSPPRTNAAPSGGPPVSSPAPTRPAGVANPTPPANTKAPGAGAPISPQTATTPATPAPKPAATIEPTPNARRTVARSDGSARSAATASGALPRATPVEPGPSPYAVRPAEPKPSSSSPPVPVARLPAVAPPIHAPPPRAVMEGASERAIRCLRCGYPLQAGGKLRCSECGGRVTPAALARWFDGEMEAHLKVLSTLALIVLALKLWVLLPNLASLARLGDATVAACTCALARQQKEGGLGAIFGMAGAIAAGSGILFAFSAPLEFYTLNLVAAPLLVCAVLNDPDVGDVLGRAVTRAISIGIALLAPLVAAGLFFMERSLQGAALPDPTFVLKTAIPHVLATAAWGWAWWTLRQVQRSLYAPLPDSR